MNELELSKKLIEYLHDNLTLSSTTNRINTKWESAWLPNSTILLIIGGAAVILFVAGFTCMIKNHLDRIESLDRQYRFSQEENTNGNDEGLLGEGFKAKEGGDYSVLDCFC